MSSFKTLNVGVLVLDPKLQSRIEINEETVGEYADAMEQNDKFPPVLAYFDGIHYYLTDGYHRYHATRRVGKASIDCEIINGTLRDAILHSTAVNSKHGMRRSYADKRKAVMTLLEDFEWEQWSNIRIAEQCGVSNTFVASLRKGGDTRDKVKYVTPTGKVMEKAKIKKKEKEPVLKEAPPPPPEDQTKEAIDMLVAENEQLKDRLAVGAMDGSPEERALAEQTITELREEVRILKIELTAVKSSRDTFQAENQQLKAQIKMLNSKLKKAGVE